MNQMPSIHGPTLQLLPFNLTGPVMRFSIVRRDNNRRAGILLISAPNRNSEDATLELLISDPEKRELYGLEVLQLGLQAAFGEQRRRRVIVRVPEYDAVSIRLVEQAGFMLHGRLSQVIFLRERFWDDLLFGLEETEWRVKVPFESVSLPVERYC